MPPAPGSRSRDREGKHFQAIAFNRLAGYSKASAFAGSAECFHEDRLRTAQSAWQYATETGYGLITASMHGGARDDQKTYELVCGAGGCCCVARANRCPG